MSNYFFISSFTCAWVLSPLPTSAYVFVLLNLHFQSPCLSLLNAFPSMLWCCLEASTKITEANVISDFSYSNIGLGLWFVLNFVLNNKVNAKLHKPWWWFRNLCISIRCKYAFFPSRHSVGVITHAVGTIKSQPFNWHKSMKIQAWMKWGGPIWPHSKPCQSITVELIQGYFINGPCIFQVLWPLTTHTLTISQPLHHVLFTQADMSDLAKWW